MCRNILSVGPIYTNCFPNFSIHIEDNNVLRALKVDIKTYDFDMEEGTSNIAHTFRVYFKVMNTICPNISLKSFIKDNRGKTILLQTNLVNLN